MTQTDPGRPGPYASNTSTAMIIYVLYFVGYVVGITAIVGVIMAHVQKGSGDAMLESHYDFQIRTFWVGLLYTVVGVAVLFAFFFTFDRGAIMAVLIAALIFLWSFVWSLVRNIKGALALNERRPITNPYSWMFG